MGIGGYEAKGERGHEEQVPRGRKTVPTVDSLASKQNVNSAPGLTEGWDNVIWGIDM
jgi:hypothetical protein